VDDDAGADALVAIIEAVAIDNLERNRSNGYVVQTEVMPARAPLANRVGVSNCFFPFEVKNFLSCSYVVNWTALYGMIRTQLIPFPRMNPLNPSSSQMRMRLRHTPVYCFPEFLGWTCCIILSRSSGDTTVRDAAPAIPPAMKYDDTCGLNHASGLNADAGADEELAAVVTADCLDVIAVLDRVDAEEYRSWTDL